MSDKEEVEKKEQQEEQQNQGEEQPQQAENQEQKVQEQNQEQPKSEEPVQENSENKEEKQEENQENKQQVENQENNDQNQENQENKQQEDNQENKQQEENQDNKQENQQQQETKEEENKQEVKKEEKKNDKKDNKDGDKKGDKKDGEENGEEEEEDENKQKVIPEDFFYEEDHVEKELQDSPITNQICDFHESFGFDSNRRNNVLVLDMDHMIFSGGVNYFIVNIIDGETQIFFSKDGGGIGSIAVHPSKKYFAVAEKGEYPNIYIYEYPSLKLYRILRKGTEKTYSCCNFSNSGDILASVGSSPDYTISLWNWKQEIVILKSKAFSQEVYNVEFSQYSENILTTCGLAHVKFWKVAETFTGLKLKGEIAKFGQVELSDVVAQYTFPDGKVISSTEYGKLLLWEGNLIKCVINISQDEEGNDVNCHEGEINVIFRQDNDIITAGSDGYIKFWDATVIDNSESDEFSNFYIKPNHTIQLFTEPEVPCNIINICTFEGFWLVSDQNGKIIKLEISESKQNHDQTIIKETNSGRILDVALSPVSNCSVTIGDDGVVRLWDYVNQREFYCKKFPGKGTCVEWLPYTKKNQARIVIIGYDTGVVRWLLINQNGFQLLKPVKVHSSPIKFIKASPDGQNIAILSQKGDIFIIEQNQSDLQKLEPFCLYETGLQIRDMQWDKMGEKLLLASNDGKIYETAIQKKDDCDISDTYKQEFNYRSWTMKMMEFQKPKADDMDITFLMKHKNEEKKEFDEWEPAPIMNATYYDASCSKVLISVEGKYLGWYYLVDWNQERPIEAFPAPKIQTQFMKFQNYEDFLLIGLANGSWQLRHIYDLQSWATIKTHDINYGKVFKLALNYDKTAILSAGGDGFQYAYKFDQKNFIQCAKGETVEEFSYPELTNGITEGSFNDEIELFDRSELQDIIDHNIYSIQEAKLLAEEDFRKKQAEEKKQVVLQEVKKLVLQFEEYKAKNMQIDDIARLTSEEMTIDHEYIAMLKQRVKEDLDETQLEVKWEAEYHRLLTAKLQNYVKDELLVDTFTVIGIKKENLSVKTFKLKKLNEYLEDNLSKMYREMEEAKAKEDQERENQQKEQNNAQGLGNNLLNHKQNDKEEKEADKFEDEFEDANLTGAKLERLKHKREEARIKRELEQLEKEKSAHESSEPDHIKEIDEAKRNLGDYKLKSDPDYDVQESQRKNVSKQRKYMFLMEQFIYKQKKDFNDNMIALRQRKKNIIEKIREYNGKISEINKQLGENKVLFQPEINTELEEPEKFYEVTEEEIDKYEAEKNPNQEKINQEKQAAANAKKGNQQKEKEKEKKKQADQGEKLKTNKKQKRSELEEEVIKVKEMILEGEKKRMQAEIDEEIEQFDTELEILQKSKQTKEVDMIIAQMNLITYYQELVLLVDMEEYDNYLIKNVLDCKNEKQALKNESDKIVKELNELVTKDAENEKALQERMKEFKEMVHPDDEHKREKLLQYWFKKHKKLQQRKMKHQENEDQDGDDDDEDEMDSDEDDDDDFMDDDDDERVDMSPIEQDNGTNKNLLDKICELEESQENYRKEKMEKERAKVQIANKIQNVVKNLQTASNDMKQYQTKKLGKVNQLNVSFCLKLSQIQHLIEVNTNTDTIYQLPQKLNQSILFTQEEFTRLSFRIKELVVEKDKIEKQKKKLSQQQKKRDKERGELQLKYAELNKKYEEKHILKFGDIIDLKVLDALQPTKQVLEMREKFKQEEREAIKRVEKAKQSLLKKKQELLDARKENTKIIKQITKLGEEQMKLNKKLDSSNKQLFKEDNEDKKNKNDLEKEKQNLRDLVKFLAKEIDDLKTEIGLFKRKGGHIYTMVTSNKKNFA